MEEKEKKPPKIDPPKVAIVIDARRAMDIALANMKVLDEIWVNWQEKKK